VIDDDAEEFTTGDGTTRPRWSSSARIVARRTSSGSTRAAGRFQEYVEDCQVCCRPWRVTVRYAQDGSAEVFTEPLDG